VWAVNTANSLVAYIPANDVVLLLIDNDNYWDGHLQNTFRMLDDVQFDPSVVVLGPNNSPDPKDENSEGGKRVAAFAAHFPNAAVIPLLQPPIGSECPAEFKDCKGKAMHQCMPGPGVTKCAQDLLRNISALV
jgi:hypothetical protein